MAVTAGIFFSPIFKRKIEVFSLAQTIIKIKYYIGIYGCMTYRSYDAVYSIERIYTKKLDFSEQPVCFFSLLT